MMAWRGGFTPDWLIIEQSGGVISDYKSSGILGEIRIIEIDYDELEDAQPDEAVTYFIEKLDELRTWVPPGPQRKAVRLAMSETVAWARAWPENRKVIVDEIATVNWCRIHDRQMKGVRHTGKWVCEAYYEEDQGVEEGDCVRELRLVEPTGGPS